MNRLLDARNVMLFQISNKRKESKICDILTQYSYHFILDNCAFVDMNDNAVDVPIVLLAKTERKFE